MVAITFYVNIFSKSIKQFIGEMTWLKFRNYCNKYLKKAEF